MKKFEKVFENHLFLMIVTALAFVAWISVGKYQWLNQGIIAGFLIAATITMTLFEDSSKALPFYLSLLFMVNTKQIGLTDIQGFSFLYVVGLLVALGFALHLLRFRHKYQFGWLTPGLLLIAISYMLPLIYIDYSTTLLVISLSGFGYVLLYLFFRNTSESKTDTILTFLFYISLLLLSQMAYVFIKGFLAYPKETHMVLLLRDGLKTSWGVSDFGYGNINDVIIFFTLASAGQLYMLLKYPKRICLWVFPILSVAAVLFSGSRGGYLAWTVLIILYYLIMMVKGTKAQLITMHAIALVGTLVVVFTPYFLSSVYLVFKQGGINNFDTFTSWRISLYKQAWQIFRKFKWFGAGWTYMLDVGNSNRIQVYHSTFFHTIAISGAFGLLSVAVFMFSQLLTAVKKFNLNVAIVGAAWLVTALHGILDNTVHMIIYTILTLVIFSAIERDESIEEKGYEEELENQPFPFLVSDE